MVVSIILRQKRTIQVLHVCAEKHTDPKCKETRWHAKITRELQKNGRRASSTLSQGQAGKKYIIAPFIW